MNDVTVSFIFCIVSNVIKNGCVVCMMFLYYCMCDIEFSLAHESMSMPIIQSKINRRVGIF